jgi:uncharacterized protein (TIGR04141 family)
VEKEPESVKDTSTSAEISGAEPETETYVFEEYTSENKPGESVAKMEGMTVSEELLITPKKQFSVRLGAFLVLSELKNLSALLSVPITEVDELAIDASFKVDGIIYVKKKPTEIRRPAWAGYLDALHGSKVDGLETASSSAILVLKVEKGIVVFSFGYGRHLINDEYLVSDFGIKTALNTLDHNTLRAVDLFSLEQSPIQKRSQATKSASINEFGIDVSRDVLKGVTGEPIKGVGWSTITGGGAQYGLTAKITGYGELVNIAEELIKKYEVNDYEENFAWVDNIQRVRNSSKVAALNEELIKKIKEEDSESIALSLPEISEWGEIFGFTYTNGRGDIKSSPDVEDYYSCNNVDEISIERLRQHKLYYTLISGEEFSFPILDCIYFECIYEDKTYILFSRQWFAIDQDYVKRVETAVQTISLSSIDFPKVKLVEKKKKTKSVKKPTSSDDVDEDAESGTEEEEEYGSTTPESEGDYNIRVATELGYILMDKKLVKSDSSTSPVEVCDILTPDKQFIHAKHRKGSSSGLSHLFAQGRVAAELLLSDKNFRKNARKHLENGSKELIPLGNFRSKSNEIIFLILGDSTDVVIKKLPFFSKVNLISAYKSLSERQFKVSIAGAEFEAIVPKL